jgi:putative RecB family exonuclease
MVIYSHSRLSTFEECPKKFQFKYIYKIKPPIEKTMETHLGKVVHETLEWLYLEIKNKKYVPSLDDVLIYYGKKWEKNWDDGIKNIKKQYTRKDYYNLGIQYLLNYYMKYRPFGNDTLDVEKRIFIDLDKEGKYKVQGYIDRLVYNKKTGEYEIHDYKTSIRLPKLEDIENDRQLALYSIAIRENFGKDKKIKLIWHYLAYNREIKSKRTDDQLEKLKEDTYNLIKTIETTKNFPIQISRLCDWCEYKPICPAWNENPPTNKKDSERILEENNTEIRKQNQNDFEKERRNFSNEFIEKKDTFKKNNFLN